jgi:hypothetical protein
MPTALAADTILRTIARLLTPWRSIRPTITAYGVGSELEEHVAQVISCPHCNDTSVVMKATVLSIKQKGVGLVETLAIPLHCNECGANWCIKFTAESGQKVKPLALLAEIGQAV